jgi:CheY-like chemotaxis protein
MVLRHAGARAVAAADGWEALVCARTLLPALVVADVRMPGLDGWALLARLRAAPRTTHIPVLLVTADPTCATPPQARAAGAVAVLGKPLDLWAFRRLVRRLLLARED